MEKDAAGRVAGIDGYLFRLIATFEAAGMQQLGKIAHPLTGDVEIDLDGARDSIEMLAAIQRKTEGNLNDDEKRLLEHVLYQLRMNFVDVKKEQESAADERTEGASDAAAESAADGPTGGATDGAAESAADGAAAGADEKQPERSEGNASSDAGATEERS